jgi:hypothetical protein
VFRNNVILLYLKGPFEELSVGMNYTLSIYIYAGHTQTNGAVLNVIEKFTPYPTQAQQTLPAARTVQVYHALPAVRFSFLLLGRRTSFQDGVADL